MINYNNDFYGWTQEQADLLRAGRMNDIDIENLIDEIECMGRTEKREVTSRLTIVLLHLLKWRFQPERRGNSWKKSIDLQRKQFKKVILENPSLKPLLPEILSNAYDQAIYDAYKETGLDLDTFPTECPWSFEQADQDGFYPD